MRTFKRQLGLVEVGRVAPHDGLCYKKRLENLLSPSLSQPHEDAAEQGPSVNQEECSYQEQNWSVP